MLTTMDVFWILYACCVVQLTAGYDWEQYKGYRVIATTPTTESHIKSLQILEKTHTVSFWDELKHPHKPVSILVGPSRFDEVSGFLHKHRMRYTIIDEDVSRRLEEEWTRLENRDTRAYDYADYNDFETIITELDNLASQCHPDLVCTTSTIGLSLEGRPQRMLEIKKAGTPNTQAIWIDSTIHAREWLSPATTMNIFREMITTYPDGPTAMLMSFNWYYVPVHNPDGYNYSWTDDRFWRKNRRVNENTTCMGVDLNRNFDINWSEPGADPDPCGIMYYGTAPASEPEVENIQNTVMAISQSDNLRGFWTVHTYGQEMLYGYGNCTLPPDVDEIKRVTTLICDAIEETYNTTWDCGSVCVDLSYETSGMMSDWAYGKVGITYSWTPELRGGAFDPPASEIPFSFAELYNGLQALAIDLINTGP